ARRWLAHHGSGQPSLRGLGMGQPRGIGMDRERPTVQVSSQIGTRCEVGCAMRKRCLCGVVGCRRHKYHKPGRYTHYGSDHKRRRKLMLIGIANGTIPAICARCGWGTRPWDPWEAGHLRPLGQGPEVRPEHRSCNRRHGAQLKEEMRKVKAKSTVSFFSTSAA